MRSRVFEWHKPFKKGPTDCGRYLKTRPSGNAEILKETVSWKRADPIRIERKCGIFSLQRRQKKKVRPGHYAKMVTWVGKGVLAEILGYQLVPTAYRHCSPTVQDKKRMDRNTSPFASPRPRIRRIWLRRLLFFPKLKSPL